MANRTAKFAFGAMLFLITHILTTTILEKRGDVPALAQILCFNNPWCHRPAVSSPPRRAKGTTISWDMDTGSFGDAWAWSNEAPGVNFESATNNASYEWTQGYLHWDQRDSAGQARATGNTVVTVGVRTWARWLGKFKVTGILRVQGYADPDWGSGCDIPAGWQCADEWSIRINGYTWWLDGNDCGIGSQSTVGLDRIHPDPDLPDCPATPECLDKKYKNKKLPNITRRVNVRHVMVHEFGHAVGLYDQNATCVPQDTVMEWLYSCDDLLLSCPSPFHTSNDVVAVQYLYGP